MKSICLIDYDMSVRGGVEQVTTALANALSEHYEVHVLSLCQNGALAYSFRPEVHYAVVLEREERLREMRRDAAPKLADYFEKHSISCAIIQGNYPGFIVSALRGRTAAKLVFCDHGALRNQWERRDIVAIRAIASLLCHRTVTLTEQSREDYHRRLLVPRHKLQCIYNWIDLDLPHSEHYDAGSKKIVSAGRFGKEKGFDQLVRAFAPVAKKHPDWTLELYGDGEMMPTVRALVEELGLQTQVKLLGMRTDLAAHYGEYAMYVLPSYREGMPLVLLEAKANRLPIVSFDVMTGPREIVRDGIDGILVPPQDLEALGAAMCRLIEDGELRAQMSQRSQENLTTFSKETILAQWIALIESLGNRKGE